MNELTIMKSQLAWNIQQEDIHNTGMEVIKKGSSKYKIINPKGIHKEESLSHTNIKDTKITTKGKADKEEEGIFNSKISHI